MSGSEYAESAGNNTEKYHREIFDGYFGLVYTIVHGRLYKYASREDIEECVSDVFADLFLSLENDRKSIADIKGYVRMIAARRAVDMYRRLSPKAGKNIPMDEAGEIISPEDTAGNIEKANLRNILLKKIAGLGEPDSSIIIRRYYFGHSASEIAESLSVTDSAVRKRCSKALERLRKELKEYDIDL